MSRNPPVPLHGRARPVHGVGVGILVLDTAFHRLPGDVANALTWRFPVQFRVVHGATPQKVIGGAPDEVLSPFLRGIDGLVALGVDAITTTCGFLAALQPRLAAHSPVPIAASSLLQIPLVQRVMPKGRKVGVVTTEKAALSDAHFVGVGAPTGLPLAELPADGIIRGNMRDNASSVDRLMQEREALAVVDGLLAEHPDIGAVVLECANLGPYSAAIQRSFGIAVYDIVTLVEWLHGGLRPRRFAE